MLSSEEKKAYCQIVQEVARLETEKKTLSGQVKDLLESARDKFHISVKATKQMAKETNWNELERMDQANLEAQQDECRLALGLLVGTPLGDAAERNVEREYN